MGLQGGCQEVIQPNIQSKTVWTAAADEFERVTGVIPLFGCKIKIIKDSRTIAETSSRPRHHSV
jgi:hypothetical protein